MRSASKLRTPSSSSADNYQKRIHFVIRGSLFITERQPRLGRQTTLQMSRQQANI